jgi:hypothetical protein
MASTAPTPSSWLSDSKNWIIVVLMLILVFSALGGSVLKPLLGGFQQLLEALTKFVRDVIGAFSYSSGQILESGADTVHTVGDATLSVGTGVLDDIANLLKGESAVGVVGGTQEPRPTPPEHPVQGTQTQWCLVGEYNDQRSCLEVSDQEKCLSGQLFTDRNKCINPGLSK